MTINEILIETVGYASGILVLIAFLLNAYNFISSQSNIYRWLNIIGSLGLIIHTYVHHAYPSTIVNVVWIIVAITSLFRKPKITT